MLAASMDKLPLAAINPLLTMSPLSFKSMLLADRRLPLPLSRVLPRQIFGL
jgi:hypothetical protein